MRMLAAGNDDVWIADPSGGNPLNLTASFTGPDAWPAWSPDGRNVAFYSERDGGGIYTMTALGANVRRVVPLKSGVLYTFSLSWARDGSIVFTGFDVVGVKQVYRVAAAGGEPACLTCDTAVGEGRAGELSPSGEFLAFLSGLTGPRAVLSVRHLASGRVQEVTGRADAPHWSSDGRRIVFVSNRDGQSDLWEVGIDPRSGSADGQPRRLTSALGATTFALAPDGRQLLAVKEEGTSHLWSVPLTAPASDLGLGTQVTSGNVRDQRGRWAGDGKSVFFESGRRGSSDIWRLDPGGALVRLTTDPGSELRPRPSPRGGWVAYDSVGPNGEFTHVMRFDGSQSHPLDERWLSTYRQICCADWSPDGTRLALVVTPRVVDATGDPGTIGVVSFDQTSGRAGDLRLLDLPGGLAQYARWSPDGNFIVYEAVTEGSWDLWMVNPDAPEPRRLTRFAGNERSGTWQKNPRAVVFLRDSHEIWRLPVDRQGTPSGSPQRWLASTGRQSFGVDGLDVSPSGDRLMLTLGTAASDIWLVELGGK
jgi:Tol biopolymer transport system component